jgi:hypothetical protein
MASEFDYQKWLADAAKNANLTPEQLKPLEELFGGNENFKKYAGESFLRQSDYSRKQNELADKIAAKEDEISRYEAKLADWEKQTKAEFDKAVHGREVAQRNLDKLQNQFRTVTQTLKKGYDDYGVPLPQGVQFEPDLPTDSPVPAASVNPNLPPAQKPNWVDQNEYTKFANAAIATPFELQDVAAEHYQLYGKPLGNTRSLLDKVASSKGRLNLRSAWEEEYEVPQRRQQIADEQFNQKVNSEVDKRYQAKISEALQPSPAREGHHSAVLRQKLRLPDGSENKPPAPVSAEQSKDEKRGVMAAVQAHMAGTYRQNNP